MRLVSRAGLSSACARLKAGRLFSLAMKRPCTWQPRMRNCSITGVLLASDSEKPSSTALTMLSRLGRGSSSQICDFMANACERSCMMDEPSP